MMGVLFEARGHHLLKLAFYVARRLAFGQTQALRNSEDMRVDCNRWLTKGYVQNHVGGLSADAGQAFQLFSRARHFAFKPFNQ